MNEILSKISSYNIFNYLFPGILFAMFTKYYCTHSFAQDDITTGVFIYYFLGLIISRLGSIVVEPVLKWTKFVKFADYGKFVSASKVDAKIELLSESNNMYRTLVATSIVMLLFKLYEIITEYFEMSDINNPYLIIILIFCLFMFSYRKQTLYITKRVNGQG